MRCLVLLPSVVASCARIRRRVLAYVLITLAKPTAFEVALLLAGTAPSTSDAGRDSSRKPSAMPAPAAG